MDLGESKARPEEHWRRVMFVWKRDGDPLIDGVMGVITEMKEELKRRGISVYDNDFGDDEEDKYRCNLEIIFMSKYFFIDCFDDHRKYFRWLRKGKTRAIIILDNQEHKFLSYVRYSVNHPREHLKDDGYWDPDYLEHHGIYYMDASALLGGPMYYSPINYRAIVPGISPPQDFVTKYADDVEVALKPMGLDLANIDRTLRSDVLDIYDHLLLQRKKNPLGVLLAVFTACQCCCFDITIISRMIALRRSSAGTYKFVTSVNISMKDECYRDIENGPLTLQTALIRRMYRSFQSSGDYFKYHLDHKRNTTKTFVRIDHFDVSNPYAQQQLANIACLFGAKSLVIVTSNASSSDASLFETKMNFVSRVRGTNCNKDTIIMSKCYYKIFISELEQKDDSKLEAMDTSISDDKQEIQGAAKKLKTHV